MLRVDIKEDIYMEFTCDECYQLRQKSIDICPRCGKKTLESRVIGCSSLVKCTNCGMQAASTGGFFASCHEDERMYALRVYESSDTSSLVKLAKILNRNALELKKQFNDGRINLQFKVMECLEKKEKITEVGIRCEIDDEMEMVFPRIIDCPYAKGIYEEWQEFDERFDIVSKIYDQLHAYSYIFEGAFVERKASNEDIEHAEELLGFNLPESYNWYLREFGHGGYFFEFMGVGLSGRLVFVDETIALRKEGMPHNLLAFQNCDEYVDCIDVNTGLVVTWSMFDDNGVLCRNIDFYEFFLDEINNAIDNYDE